MWIKAWALVFSPFKRLINTKHVNLHEAQVNGALQKWQSGVQRTFIWVISTLTENIQSKLIREAAENKFPSWINMNLQSSGMALRRDWVWLMKELNGSRLVPRHGLNPAELPSQRKSLSAHLSFPPNTPQWMGSLLASPGGHGHSFALWIYVQMQRYQFFAWDMSGSLHASRYPQAENSKPKVQLH